MGNVSREVEILGKKEKEMLEIKDTVTEIKNAFDGLISKWDVAEQTVSELESISKEACKTEKQREK